MTTTQQNSSAAEEKVKVGIGGYIAFALAVCFFSGVFYKMPEGYKWLGAFDFTTLIGAFGKIAGTKSTFVGAGGVSARAGFLFALSLVPGVMLAMGLIEVLEHYGALRAAQKIMTPLLKPVLGVSGNASLALVTDLQSTDGGAALTRGLWDEGKISRKSLIVIAAWQYAGAGCIANYFSTVSALFAVFTCPVWVPVVIILVMKFVGGALFRLVLNTVYKKDFENEPR
jgi:nucleoside recognition membrane protein YjiH